MKVFTHLYKEITSLPNLFQAWEEFKKGKRKKIDVGEFERHLEDNIFQLHRELRSKTYRHSNYTGFYIKDPKQRHIHKAFVKDRIVHHALFKILNPIFESTFIPDSFSSREGFGIHKGFQKLVSYSRKVSRNYTQDCWSLKCDVRKFFDSVDHKILLEIVGRKIKDPEVKWLLKEIIKSFGKDKGIPIGNLTSQLFANIYLNELDQFVKHNLRVKYYLRYADDFVLLNKNREELVKQKENIRQFLEEKLNLSLHPNKVYLRKLSWGIDFVGYIARPHHQLLRSNTQRRVFRKVREKVDQYRTGGVSQFSLQQSLQSYLGVLKHSSSYKLKKILENQIWFWLCS